MKLKKGISLLLVLTMALSFMSFAFTVAAVDDTANIEIVADKDTAELTVGDTFVANVQLSEIVAKQLRGVQVAVEFDPTVLQVVDSAGEATTNVSRGTIPCDDMYDEDEETGFFDRLPCEIDNTEGRITYSIGQSFNLAGNSDAHVACDSGEYTAVGIRFKVLKEGQTGLAFDMDGVEVYCASLTEQATVTDVTDSIRIGVAKQDIVSVDAIQDQKVAVDTPLEEVINLLPKEVSVSFDDGSKGKATVAQWACASYQAGVGGDYTFEGTLETSEYITNSQNLKATVKVTVTKLEIVSIEEGSGMVPYGATKEQVDALLPATVTVTLEGNQTAELPVTWTYTYTAEETTGDVEAEGEVDLGTKYLNTNELKAAYTLTISEKIDTATDATLVAGSVPSTITVAYEDDKTEADVIAKLPKVVELTVGDKTVAAFVTWKADEGYDPATAGTYTFTGTITLPENVNLSSNTVSVDVRISEAVEKTVKSVDYTFEAKTTKTSSTTYLYSLYPSEVDVTYQDGTKGKEAVVWDATSLGYTASRAGDYTLNGKVGDISVSARVTVESSSIDGPGGGDNDQTVYIYMNSKTVNNTTQTILSGRAFALTASENVTWSSSNSSIAMITSDGRLIGNSPGIATITATGSSGYGVFYVQVVMDPSIIAQIGDEDEEEIVIPFSDLADYSWASRMIAKLAADGVVSGRTSTLYAPGDNVTRAEYASLLVRALDLTTSNEGTAFSDVASGEWYYSSVQTASALGVVAGYEDGTFRPDAQITREEMAVMSVRAATAANVTIPTLVSVTFSDADQISGYAQDAVNILSCGKIISGMGDGRFAPQETANRAQAAVIIYKLRELR